MASKIRIQGFRGTKNSVGLVFPFFFINFKNIL